MPAQRKSWRRLGPWFAITVAAHAAVLSLPVRPAAASPGARTVAMQTRTVEPIVERVPASEPEISSPVDLAQPPRAAPPPRREAPRQQETAAVDSPVAPAPAEVPPAASGWALPGIADEDDLFVARSLLAVAPTPLAPVLIDYPAFAGPSERYRGELTLFIDEQGVVVRVHAEGQPLPAMLEEAARRAFMAVRFSPGELAEQGAVKSRIRVEVVFEGGAPLLLG